MPELAANLTMRFPLPAFLIRSAANVRVQRAFFLGYAAPIGCAYNPQEGTLAGLARATPHL
jgi:hydroxypyruvate isomerase